MAVGDIVGGAEEVVGEMTKRVGAVVGSWETNGKAVGMDVSTADGAREGCPDGAVVMSVSEQSSRTRQLGVPGCFSFTME